MRVDWGHWWHDKPRFVNHSQSSQYCLGVLILISQIDAYPGRSAGSMSWGGYPNLLVRSMSLSRGVHADAHLHSGSLIEMQALVSYPIFESLFPFRMSGWSTIIS